MSPSDKITISNNIPESFTEIITGLMLGDGNVRMNGKHALLSVQQKNKEFVEYLWSLCKEQDVVENSVKELKRLDKRFNVYRLVYGFQSFTLPYFTKIYNLWYINIEGTYIKIVPKNIDTLLTPKAIAYWISGDGTFDKSKNRVIICTDNFTIEDTKSLQNVLLNKFNINSYLKSAGNKSKDQYRIVIPRQDLVKFQELIKPHLHEFMYYRIGL
jgi:hypothetical protein